jgi:hypothetical protein
LHVRDRETIAAFCLLKTLLAWEDFIETTFLRYMCGARTTSGYAPALQQSRAGSIGQAYAVLAGRQRYLAWNPTDVIQRSGVFFQKGEPYTSTIATMGILLQEMIAVRNAIAHRSSFAQQKFRSVVVSRFGFVPRGMTPGRFVMSIDPGNGQAMFDGYVGAVSVGARAIVP